MLQGSYFDQSSHSQLLFYQIRQEQKQELVFDLTLCLISHKVLIYELYYSQYEEYVVLLKALSNIRYFSQKMSVYISSYFRILMVYKRKNRRFPAKFLIGQTEKNEAGRFDHIPPVKGTFLYLSIDHRINSGLGWSICACGKWIGSPAFEIHDRINFRNGSSNSSSLKWRYMDFTL